MELVGNRETTLAVLPFKILSRPEALSPVIVGFTEDLILNFSKFYGLSVISQLSTQHIHDPGEVESIGKLGADYIVAGSFRLMGETIRIGTQLIRFKDAKVVFAGHHDEKLEAILDSLDRITHQLVSVLQQQIDHDLLSYSYKKEAVELQAYENWLLGMSELKKGTLENDLTARKYFEAALKIDPMYARAYTGLSLSYFNEWSCQLWDRWDVSQKGAHDYALKAIQCDENDYLSLTVLGRTYLYLGEYERAEQFLRKSLRMNPNDPDNLILISISMVYLGLNEEAEQLYLRACALNPLHRDNYLPHGMTIYFEKGEFRKSVTLGEKVKDIGIWTDFTAYMAACYFHLSEFEPMKAYWEKYLLLFSKNICLGEPATKEQALEWQQNVNPYRGATRLQAFWNHMGSFEIVEPTNGHAVQLASFILKNDLWEIKYGNKHIILQDAKGLHDIARLLASPEKEFHCAELMKSKIALDSGTLVFDAKAKKNYQAKIKHLQQAIHEAEEEGKTAELVELQEQYDYLIEHLSSSLGLAGKTRKLGSSVEKARSAVTWRIRKSIKNIREVHPPLGKHLSASIKTGTSCSYHPELKVRWTT